MLSLGQFELGGLLERFVGGVVGLPVSHLTVTDLVLAPGGAIGAGTQEVALRAELMATPADSYSPAVVRLLFPYLHPNPYATSSWPRWQTHIALLWCVIQSLNSKH